MPSNCSNKTMNFKWKGVKSIGVLTNCLTRMNTLKRRLRVKQVLYVHILLRFYFSKLYIFHTSFNIQCIHVRNKKSLSSGPNHNETFGHAFFTRLFQHIHTAALSLSLSFLLYISQRISLYLTLFLNFPVTRFFSVSRKDLFC